MLKGMVSVVMPVHNGRRHLKQAVQSVLGQTYAPVELICVDDGSTDDSAELLAGYGDRLTLIRQRNTGVAGARNRGIVAAGGEFVAFLDQDDWWQPEKLARQVERFETEPAVGLVHTGIQHWDDQRDAPTGPINPEARPERLVGDCLQALLLGNQIYNSSVVVRRDVIDVVGPCDMRIAGNTIADYDLWLRIARRSRFAYLDEPLCFYRVHPDQGLWDFRKLYGAEVELLERLVREGTVEPWPEFRGHVADLYQLVGTAHLDAAEMRPARRHYWRSVRWQFTSGGAIRLAASCLPGPLVRLLQRIRARRRAKNQDEASALREGLVR